MGTNAGSVRGSMVKKPETTLDDLMGLGHTKLGFFKEVQVKIRELRTANRKLEEKRRDIQAILDGITDVMAVVSPDFKIISVNHVFFKTFSHKSPQNKYCYQVFRNRDHPCNPCPLAKALEKNTLCRQMAIYNMKGKNRQFEITASPLGSKKGKPGNILVLKRDVTVEKEYQAKYYHAEKMATIGLLAAGVAHEINNPLTGISGFAEGLKRRMPKLKNGLAQNPDTKGLAEDFEEYINTIMSECSRCRDIVQNLLTFSPRTKAVSVPIDLNALVFDILKILDHQLKKRLSDPICLNLAPELPQPAGSPAELKQVVLNLVLNALDAIEQKGHIIIRTRTKGKWAELIVEDTGTGISPGNMDKLFEPFYTTKPVGQGIGIGLSTCYNIIRQHNGDILVQSIKGRGSVFIVRLLIQQK